MQVQKDYLSCKTFEIYLNFSGLSSVETNCCAMNQEAIKFDCLLRLWYTCRGPIFVNESAFHTHNLMGSRDVYLFSVRATSGLHHL
jgi:hypothetical protein